MASWIQAEKKIQLEYLSAERNLTILFFQNELI